jgi:hypothetical protein
VLFSMRKKGFNLTSGYKRSLILYSYADDAQNHAYRSKHHTRFALARNWRGRKEIPIGERNSRQHGRKKTRCTKALEDTGTRVECNGVDQDATDTQCCSSLAPSCLFKDWTLVTIIAV